MKSGSIWALRITAVLIGALALPMLWYGADLLFAGGTPYYAVAGLLMTLSAVTLWRKQPHGFYLFAATLLLTLGWAWYETGASFWLAGSRIWLVGLLSLWLCTPWIRRAIWGAETRPLLRMRSVQVCAVATVGLFVAMFASLFPDIEPTDDTIYGPPQNNPEWTAYGANSAGTRYGPHEQINRDTVNGLVRAWEADTGRVGRFSGTPIQVGDGLYLCTAQNVMIALDADTGAERWRYDPENATPPYGILGNCRGVTHYQIPQRPPTEHCASRIYTATTDARMIAVDRATGEPCAEFGGDGQISLLAGMGEVKPYYYFVTSPPTLASGSLVVGGWVMDNQETEEPSGVVRGYDPRTGELLWAWDIGREGRTGMPPEGGFYTRGTPNVWSLMSADDDLGLVYVPTGNATPDYYGGHRTEIMDRFASSIVAIDARTGLTRWQFQTTHHDIWDYDVPSQPTLVDLTLQGERVKAVIVPTKRGEFFVLNRETGELLTEVTEKPVPQSTLTGERTSPTQPFGTGMPSFAYPYIHESDLFGVTPFDQMACRKEYLGLRYEGPMTPPDLRGTLLYPGPAGGQNWGSVAVDEQRQLMVVNNLHVPFRLDVIPREEDISTTEGGISSGYGIGGPQRGTPYAVRVGSFSSPLGLPCLKPPYGEIAVVDLTTQRIVWRRGMGAMNLGFPYSAGSFITAGGLIFNAGVMDGKLRAIDVDSGEVIWTDDLRTSSDATPMTYVSPTSGKQYILVTMPGRGRPVADTGHDTSGTGPESAETGGRVVAFTLP